MKIVLFSILFLLVFSIFGYGQLKKDGTPDKRYKSNKQSSYSNNSVTPKSSNNTNTAVHYQNSYTKSDGTNVRAHYKTDINNTNTDNFSTKDNYN